MKSIFGILVMSALLYSCGAKRMHADDLPKDISEKPAHVHTSENINTDQNEIFDPNDEKKMQDLLNEIDALIVAETCSNAADWRISPLGAKPCGGPSKYIAYPKAKESEILPKIQQYNALQNAYNKANNLNSDCAIVPPPTGIECENGRAILIQSKPNP